MLGLDVGWGTAAHTVYDVGGLQLIPELGHISYDSNGIFEASATKLKDGDANIHINFLFS